MRVSATVATGKRIDRARPTGMRGTRATATLATKEIRKPRRQSSRDEAYRPGMGREDLRSMRAVNLTLTIGSCNKAMTDDAGEADKVRTLTFCRRPVKHRARGQWVQSARHALRVRLCRGGERRKREDGDEEADKAELHVVEGVWGEDWAARRNALALRKGPARSMPQERTSTMKNDNWAYSLDIPLGPIWQARTYRSYCAPPVPANEDKDKTAAARYSRPSLCPIASRTSSKRRYSVPGTF